MTNFKSIKNLKIGVSQFLFNATLLEEGQNVILNRNSKDYKIVPLEGQLPHCERELQRTAIWYAVNYSDGIEVVKECLSNVCFNTKGKPQIRWSHLNIAVQKIQLELTAIFW